LDVEEVANSAVFAFLKGDSISTSPCLLSSIEFDGDGAGRFARDIAMEPVDDVFA
jgi:hypothetical protein